MVKTIPLWAVKCAARNAGRFFVLSDGARHLHRRDQRRAQRQLMKTRIFFQITERERDALLTLDACRAAWPTFARATWQALVYKRLVDRDRQPCLTPRGRALLPFLREVNAFTRHSNGRG